ncbi:hypothetical protein P691DRAFT_807319 [Macrolepiota fuliginosa MF-IS2]|uniref:Uncharacterized protein n=1 Tax=Macrolepiota fuliginosa MF-IS2 TaxID=1400762 RepID=A0A9P5X3Q8_9AGAR|nr:hypothetical protein P691DRAFT_810252 [Macrolepiota fuliginosa MF-IS2]KAF9444481.1 hypothetical protein P691DRAFT_807319 [Macrolepiota fuliginosa MF-IS2]
MATCIDTKVQPAPRPPDALPGPEKNWGGDRNPWNMCEQNSKMGVLSPSETSIHQHPISRTIR